MQSLFRRSLQCVLLLGAVTAPRAGHCAAAPNLRALGSGVANATVAPDGAHIAFQKKTAHGWRIYTSRLDGSEQKALSAGPQDDVEPAWRADGAAIAFASNRGGNYDLFSVGPDGKNLRRLTHTKIDERAPQWSPRPFGLFQPGKASTRTIVNRSTANLAPGDLKLLEMLAKGSTNWDLYKDKFQIAPMARYYKLLFVEGSGDKRQIATMRENGTMRQTLSTGMPGANYSPAWERTAGWITFLRQAGKQQAAYLAAYPDTNDLTEGGPKPQFGINLKEWRSSIQRVGVTDRAGQASWTPNGEYIAVASGSGLGFLPRPDSGLAPFFAPAAVAPYGVSWLRDARTAVVTVSGPKGPVLQKLAINNPLLDVVNLSDFDEGLTARDRRYLAANSFVAGGSPFRQMYDAYEETDYEELPIFVTTDSVLHLNHLVFDYLLRGVETEHMMPEIVAVAQHYLIASLAQMKSSSPPVAHAAEGNAAFFAVAARLAMGAVATGEITAPPMSPKDDPLAMDRDALRARTIHKQQALLQQWTAPLKATLAHLPPQVASKVDAELALITLHAGLEESPVFGGKLSGVGDPDAPLVDTRIDYSDFIPRGHYSRSEILRRYFLTTRWLSGAPFRATPDGARRSLLIMAATDAASRAKLDRVLHVMSVFVGDADDADMAAYAPLAKKVYGGIPAPAVLADEAKIKDFIALAEKLPAPRIAASRGKAFRFLPQPYTPDSEIMQGLVYDRNPPDVGTEAQPRYFALGLDVMGVLGSDRARQILDKTQFQGSFFNFKLKETQYEGYDAQYTALRKRYRAMTEGEWNRNLYTRTLHSLLPLLQPKPQRAFKFTQNQAWTDKNLNTALGTWAELKHDTMPKMPVAIEAGGEGGIAEAPLWEQPEGFVEPAPLVFRRLGSLVAAERQALAGAGYLSADVKQRLDTFDALLAMLGKIEKKQSAGVRLSPREIEQLRFFGAYQEHLTFVTAEGEGGSMEGNDMGIVADVSMAFSTRLNKQLVLQEGVGRALPIYVAIERGGRRELTRGAVFSYYEFTQPAEDRLTDEKWRDMLETRKAPTVPGWTSSFVSRVSGEDQ